MLFRFLGVGYRAYAVRASEEEFGLLTASF